MEKLENIYWVEVNTIPTGRMNLKDEGVSPNKGESKSSVSRIERTWTPSSFHPQFLKTSSWFSVRWSRKRDWMPHFLQDISSEEMMMITWYPRVKSETMTRSMTVSNHFIIKSFISHHPDINHLQIRMLILEERVKELTVVKNFNCLSCISSLRNFHETSLKLSWRWLTNKRRFKKMRNKRTFKSRLMIGFNIWVLNCGVNTVSYAAPHAVLPSLDSVNSSLRT